MAIEDIQKEVLDAATHDAQLLKKEAEKKAREILAHAKEKIEPMQKEGKESLRKEIEKERKKGA